jgi:general secretion pathway protein A
MLFKWYNFVYILSIVRIYSEEHLMEIKSQIEQNAFSLSPNPNYLYLTPSLNAVIYQARGTINRRQGLVAILADAGMGKSTVLRYLLGEFDAREDVATAFITTPQFPSFYGMVKYICAEFGLEPKRSLIAQQQLLQEFLVEQYQQNKNVVIFIDEAQMLKDEFLEGIRGLLNFETNSAKLVQIVLAGQLELKKRLDSERNKPIKSRIHSYALLNPLTDKEMSEMIQHRVDLAEIKNPFTKESLDSIWDITKGVPRHILKICDKALDYLVLQETETVSVEIVEASAEDAGLFEVVNE